MTKSMMFKLLLAGVGLTLASLAFAADGLSEVPCCQDAPPLATKPVPEAKGVEAKEVAVIDLENEKCPVMGGSAEKDVYLDYEGVRVHFCCKGCDRKFLEDPAKYLKVLGIDDLERFKKGRRAPAK